MKKLSAALLLFVLPLTAGCSNVESSNSSQDSGLSITSLDPAPLPELTNLKVSSAGAFEFMTAVYLADSLGEFEKENISIEYVNLVAQDAIPALALDQVDVSGIGITAPFFNAVAEGAEVRVVLPGPSAPLGDGLWVRKDYLAAANFESMVIGTGQGKAWPGIVPVTKYLEATGILLDKVEFQQLPIGELATALESGAVDAAWLNSPANLIFEKSGTAQKVTGYSTSEVGSGFAFGPRLLSKEPQVGQAFVRAVMRTISSYLVPGYKSNKIVAEALSEKLGLTLEQISTTGELTFSADFKPDLFTEAQSVWIEFGDILSFETPLAPEEYFDGKFVESIQ